MKKYKIEAHYVVYLDALIEIEDDEDPWDFAQQMDGSDFKEIEDYNWHIDKVEEVKK